MLAETLATEKWIETKKEDHLENRSISSVGWLKGYIVNELAKLEKSTSNILDLLS